MEIPAVYIDRNNHTTIAVMMGRKFVAHVPMDSKLVVVRTRFEEFSAEYRLLPYSVARAAEKYLGADYLPQTGAARSLLQKLLYKMDVTEEDLVAVENEAAVPNPKKMEPKAPEDVKVAKKSTAVAEVVDIKKAAKTEAKPKAEKKAGPTPPKGKEPKYSDGLKIKVLVKENPKRGTSAERFALYKNGMTVGDYVEAGGKRGDIAWDVDHEYISVG